MLKNTLSVIGFANVLVYLVFSVLALVEATGRHYLSPGGFAVGYFVATLGLAIMFGFPFIFMWKIYTTSNNQKEREEVVDMKKIQENFMSHPIYINETRHLYWFAAFSFCLCTSLLWSWWFLYGWSADTEMDSPSGTQRTERWFDIMLIVGLDNFLLFAVGCYGYSMYLAAVYGKLQKFLAPFNQNTDVIPASARLLAFQ